MSKYSPADVKALKELQVQVGFWHVQRVTSFLDGDQTAHLRAEHLLADLQLELGKVVFRLRDTVSTFPADDNGLKQQKQIVINAGLSRSVMFAAELISRSGAEVSTIDALPPEEQDRWHRAIGAEIGATEGGSALDKELERLHSTYEGDPWFGDDPYAQVPVPAPDPSIDPIGARMAELARHQLYLAAHAEAVQMQALVASGLSEPHNAAFDFVYGETMEGASADAFKSIEWELFMEKQRAIDPDADNPDRWIEIPEDDISALGPLYKRLSSSKPGRPDGWEEYYEDLQAGNQGELQCEMVVIEHELTRGIEAFVANGGRFPGLGQTPNTVAGFGLAARTAGMQSFEREARAAGRSSSALQTYVRASTGTMLQQLNATHGPSPASPDGGRGPSPDTGLL